MKEDQADLFGGQERPNRRHFCEDADSKERVAKMLAPSVECVGMSDAARKIFAKLSQTSGHSNE